MRKITEKKSKLNLVLNTLEPHETDITLKKATFIILDFEKSGNNVVVEKEVALNSLGTTIKNKPIRGYYIEEDSNDESNFGGHEVYLKENKDGETVAERNTIPMGVFTSDGYVGEVEVDGEKKEVLLADAVLWYSQFIEPIDLMVEWYNEGITIPMSCEYIYYNSEFRDGVEYHLEPLYFEAHCVLGKDIAPAYETAKLVSYNQLNQFKQLVAQLATKESEKEEKKMTLLLNELSFGQIRDMIREALPTSDSTYSYPVEIYPTYTIINEEIYAGDIYSYKYFQINYTVDGNKVVLDTENKVEVMEERNWVAINSDTEQQLNEAKEDLEKVTESLNSANEKIALFEEEKSQLNETIESLKVFETQINEINRKAKFNELSDKFEKAFNSAKATEEFKSEEVQKLLDEAVDSQEALLSLNMMVVDLLANTPSVEAKNEDQALLGLNSIRKDLIKESRTEEDEFEAIFKKK